MPRTGSTPRNPGLIVRAESPKDKAAVSRVHDLAFGRPGETRIVEALRVSPHFIPPLSLVAVDGAMIVGHILLTRITIKDGTTEHPALSLAPMAVIPAQQRRGIGSLLVRTGLRRAAELGHRLVIVLGHVDYYPRFGFTPASTLGIRPPFVAPDAAFMAVVLVPGGAAGIRGVVQFPPEFTKS
jgi:putative acetyltransferase